MIGQKSTRGPVHTHSVQPYTTKRHQQFNAHLASDQTSISDPMHFQFHSGFSFLYKISYYKTEQYTLWQTTFVQVIYSDNNASSKLVASILTKFQGNKKN